MMMIFFKLGLSNRAQSPTIGGNALDFMPSIASGRPHRYKLWLSWLANPTTEHKIEKLALEIKMKPSLALATHRSEIREIVLAHRAVNARVFGSVARGLDTDLSDLDILVDTTSETTLFDLGAIRYKLRKLLGVPVDVITPGALPDSFRQTVIAQAQPI
jgi:predicted nucleotidyltransferase